MVLEQGALSGKYDTSHPFPADSDRGAVYNPMLPQLEKLNACLKEIADAHGVATAQVPVAWAIAKGTLPIIGVTKVYQVEDAAKAAALELSEEEISRMEQLADEMQLDVIRYWEKEMNLSAVRKNRDIRLKKSPCGKMRCIHAKPVIIVLRLALASRKTIWQRSFKKQKRQTYWFWPPRPISSR